MGKKHINERGPHTTVIEGANGLLKLLKKSGAEVSPGFIEGNVRSKGRSVKLKKLNTETFEMVVVTGSSKQTFKIYGSDQSRFESIVLSLAGEGWNVQHTIDRSESIASRHQK